MTSSVGLKGHGKGWLRCRICCGFLTCRPDGTPYHARHHPGHVAVGPRRDTGEIVQGAF
jgi:hypothetical protein